MTPFEEFIAQHWWQIGSIVFVAIGGIIRFNILQKDVDKHHDSSNLNPHPNCALHSTMLGNMDKKLDRIEERQMDIYEYVNTVKNGGSK